MPARHRVSGRLAIGGPPFCLPTLGSGGRGKHHAPNSTSCLWFSRESDETKSQISQKQSKSQLSRLQASTPMTPIREGPERTAKMHWFLPASASLSAPKTARSCPPTIRHKDSRRRSEHTWLQRHPETQPWDQAARQFQARVPWPQQPVFFLASQNPPTDQLSARPEQYRLHFSNRHSQQLGNCLSTYVPARRNPNC